MAFLYLDISAGMMDQSKFGPDLQLERNWSVVLAKVDAQVLTWLQKRLSLKGRAGSAPCTSFFWSFTGSLYFPCLQTVSGSWNIHFLTYLEEGKKLMVRRQVCCQRLCSERLRMLDLGSHWFAEKLAFLYRSWTGDTVWGRKVEVVFPKLECKPRAEVRRSPGGESTYLQLRNDFFYINHFLLIIIYYSVWLGFELFGS